MINFSEGPWDFVKNYDRFYSPDKSKWIEYSDLHEINQGGPLAGNMALLYPDKGAIISDWAGGPPVWNETGSRVAFPLWETPLFKGRIQRIVIVATEAGTITVFAKKFRVLKLEKFEKNIVYGKDSTLHETKEICFDVLNAKVKTSIKYHTKERRLFPDR